MGEKHNYPNDDEIKVQWTKLHMWFLALTIISIWVFFIFEYSNEGFIRNKFWTILGYTFDIVGVTIASLKTPYYGSFFDGGKVELKRRKVEDRSFQIGMLLIGIGVCFQALGTLL